MAACRARPASVYHGADDYVLFETLLGHVLEDFGWDCHAYCLLPNHYHLVIQLLDENLSEGMQRLNGRYGQLYNERYGLTGHVSQGRFWSEVVETEEHYEQVCPYVYENADRAGLSTAAQPWPWRGGRLAPNERVALTPRKGPRTRPAPVAVLAFAAPGQL